MLTYVSDVNGRLQSLLKAKLQWSPAEEAASRNLHQASHVGVRQSTRRSVTKRAVIHPIKIGSDQCAWQGREAEHMDAPLQSQIR